MVAGYIEALPTPYGWVWIDPAGYGHRGASYKARWIQLGGPKSGWIDNGDGSYTSDTPIGIHGYPLDPSLPPPAPNFASTLARPSGLSQKVRTAMLVGAAALLYWFAVERKG